MNHAARTAAWTGAAAAIAVGVYMIADALKARSTPPVSDNPPIFGNNGPETILVNYPYGASAPITQTA